MTDISAGKLPARDMQRSLVAESDTGRQDAADPSLPFLTGLLIVGLPGVFWISVMEIVNSAFGVGLSGVARMAIAFAIVTALIIIWQYVLSAARRRNASDIASMHINVRR